MRPLRFLLTLTSLVVAFLLLVFAGPWSGSHAQDVDDRGNLGAYFNWHSPSSLFPPSAIISITDDNSTNFVARPAAFGPLLPTKSLSGQLWIGSGFGDYQLGTGDGELGCSDVPGWDDGSWTSASASGKKSTVEYKVSMDSSSPFASNSKRDVLLGEDEEDNDAEQLNGDDGTDDYLHHPLSASDGLKPNGRAAGSRKKPAHADIQSLQESAEIAGKVVLLSRGGCGFLEKVKWVQRRGGVALIVGDDIRGEALVTMYARGDTSNVTIPSLFTSHTTAQLLSSLMPSGSLRGPFEDAPRPGIAFGDKKQNTVERDIAVGRKGDGADKPSFTTTVAAARTMPTTRTKSKSKAEKAATKHGEKHQHRGWLAFLFGGSAIHGHDSRRPPSSGNMGWVSQEEFDDGSGSNENAGRASMTSTSTSVASAATPWKGPSDGFRIGVQDWRDPDLVAEQKEQHWSSTAITGSSLAAAVTSSKATPTLLRGGSITPSSGSYAKAGHEVLDMSSSQTSKVKTAGTLHDHDDEQDSSRGWFGRLLGSETGEATQIEPSTQQPVLRGSAQGSQHKPNSYNREQPAADTPQIHEGLWVTLSPTSMSSSPFFDTLLVLVVSPLVTLTIVYALLLLRSRIRRRRWRAPKSVVERLPVRTYQTMPSSSGSSTSSVTSIVDATTPLLPAASRPISARPRPRARTAPEGAEGTPSNSDDMASPSLEQIEEKRAAGLAEWRRRYGGKQRECVVCLEEYVDGVSRVMSLPCGHEFHAECITPWLTTRRRTCPICKGDVVRSLARSSGVASTSSAMQQQSSDLNNEGEEDVQEQVVTTINDDPAAQQPVSREDEAFEDLERGMAPDRTR